ncbi:MAG: hypothetical protein AUI14_19120 [Actinobacteria bacterium 13_2_20CM_2_71_6]|nr:MAG: hypothetical protein AUI14_19120 [Actinobacteria bacterium 13_2_20CM_2_71_6]
MVVNALDPLVNGDEGQLEEGPDPVPEARTGDPQRPTRRYDLLALGCYLLGGLWVTLHLWKHVNGRVLSAHPSDQLLTEQLLAHAVRVFTHGDNPFFTHQMNAPDGVNMMANTSMFGLTIPLVPVTLLFGPAVAFAVMATFAPLGTAFAWYWLFSRQLTRSWLAAFIGGAFCGFAPGLISQNNAHPQVATQFAVPLIVGLVCGLATTRRPVRDGVLLGLLITYQMFVSEEVLLITALGCLIFVAVWVASRWSEVRGYASTFLRGLGVAAGTALVLLAFPLWYQFAGPQHYKGLGVGTYGFGADLLSFTAYPTNSLAGNSDSLKLATNVAEENSFFGISLLAVALLATILLWRRMPARAAAVTGTVLGILSLGAYLRLNGEYVCQCGPWLPLVHLPILDSLIPTRLALALIPCIAVLLVLLVDAIKQSSAGPRPRLFRLVATGLVVAAVLPLVPMPIPAIARPAEPAFFGSGQWRTYVPDGRTLVTIPLATYEGAGLQPMQWAADQMLDFRMAGGYFLGPDPAAHGAARFGAPPRPTTAMWAEVIRTERPASVASTDRDNAVADLRFWRASVVVLVPGKTEDALRQVTTDLLGVEPTRVGGVWLWDVRTLVG